ncbi:MAG TPA: membrane protein insertase YidC [Thermodesulfobacteriota bacterium]|nr:membrane protein insertase YidC [Thermodesulfobacteriota bacterium]
MEKRAIYAILLTFLVIVAWSLIQSKFFPQPTKTQSQEVKKEQTPVQEGVPEKKPEIKELKPLKGEKTSVKPKVAPSKEVSIETQNYWAVFTSADARLKHFRLKKYKDRVNQSALALKLTQLVDEILGKKDEKPKNPELLDLVNTRENKNLPLGLTLNGASLPVEENWEVDKEQLQLLQDSEKGEIVFSKQLENGLKILKHLKFSSDQYTINLEVEVQNNSSKEVAGQVGLEWIGEIELAKLAKEDNKDYGLKYAFLRNQKVENKAFGGASTSGCVPGCGTQKTSVEPFEVSEKGDIKWFSFEGEYFAALLVPSPSKEITLSIKGSEKDPLKAEIIPPRVSILPREKVNVAYQVYLGPKDEDQLKALGVGAEKLVNFGYFTIVAKPLLWFIRFTHKVTGNYGMDIIIISILIKIIFLPLTQISFKSMKEMQRVQPEMNRLKEQYKNDKARLQQEIMLLYKRRKINPMSGCLPMLIQIPVFIALYNALQNGIEMRHAPFFLWIMDLSAKDPIYVTPIIMGATMFMQQKMTPTAGDPAQAKMFLLMPVMFTFLFLSFPSGLVLYWLINNVLSIAHQYYLNKRI